MSRFDRRSFLTSSALCVPALGVACGSAGAGNQVRTGADVVAAEGWRRLTGRVGVITNPTGTLSTLDHIVDAMHGRVDLVAVFGPEHGFRGTAQAGGSEGNTRDPRTDVPVYDIYGMDTQKLAALLHQAGVERLVFDIADVGARFYTYIWTMYTALLAAAQAGVPFVVLDRPNPAGAAVAGPRLNPRFASGVGMLAITQQHGMTVGELARLFNADYSNGRQATLEVIPVQGWSHADSFTATGLPWVPPSPNIPTPDTAVVYPGTGLFEGTLLSEGRGTTRPFEIIGAPGIDWRWADELNAANLPGVRFRETYFVPTFSKFTNVTCGGVQLHRTGALEPIRTAITMLVTVRRLYPEVFGWQPDNRIDQLSGSDRLRRMVDSGASAADILGSWDQELTDFQRQRAPHLLYR